MMRKPQKVVSKQRGRPTRHEGATLSKNRTFKILPLLDQQLSESATKTGRTVSAEIEHRLELSFLQDAAAGHPDTAAMLRKIQTAIALIEANTGKNWLADDAGREQFNGAIFKLLFPGRLSPGEAELMKSGEPGPVTDELLGNQIGHIVGAATPMAISRYHDVFTAMSRKRSEEEGK